MVKVLTGFSEHLSIMLFDCDLGGNIEDKRHKRMGTTAQFPQYCSHHSLSSVEENTDRIKASFLCVYRHSNVLCFSNQTMKSLLS